MSLLRVDFTKAFFEQRYQQSLLNAVADDLALLQNVECTDWLGNPMRPDASTRRKPIQWSAPDVISADRSPPHAGDVDILEISELLRKVAREGSGLECTFFVLLCFLLCDNLIDYTAAGSPAALCTAYFTGFEHRIVQGLCGRMGYSNDRSGRVLVPSKSPCEIALAERMFATRLITAHNARGNARRAQAP